jgi:cell shape-determining protein MreC
VSLADQFRSRRTIIIVLVLLSLTLLTFDARGNGFIDGARRSATDIVAPVRNTGRSAFRPVENVWHGIFDYDELKRENARLQEQVALQEGVSIADEAQVREYQELLAMNKLPTIAGIPSVTAEVVSQPTSNFELTMEINQGSRVGVKIGMPVVSAAGLVGRVTQVSERRSIVRLLSDPELNVAVKVSGKVTPPPLLPAPGQTAPPPTAPAAALIPTPNPDPGVDVTPAPNASVLPPPSLPAAPTTTAPNAPTTTTTIPSDQLVVRDRGILHGQGRGKPLTIDFIDRDNPIQVGDPVVTSGVDESLSPGDIPIGRVSKVSRTEGSFQLDVEVEPAAGLDDLTFVKVLLYTPEL